MDTHEHATRVWYRVAGLLRRRELAIEMIEAEIRSRSTKSGSRWSSSSTGC